MPMLVQPATSIDDSCPSDSKLAQQPCTGQYVHAAERAVHACLSYQRESILHTQQYDAHNPGLRTGDEIAMETGDEIAP